jgi:hypothetical protein
MRYRDTLRQGQPDVQPISTPILASPAVTFRTSTTRINSGEGSAKVERLSNLIAIFQKPELDFSKNRAEHDDILRAIVRLIDESCEDRSGRVQNGRVHDGAGRDSHSLGLQVQVHRPQNLFAKMVFFQQVPELAHCGLVQLWGVWVKVKN